MKNLIPKFILKKFKEKEFNGSFKAATMFIDISGFTQMTDELMKNGKEGAEILKEMINQVFTPSINIIYNNSGFITAFLGDAISAIFPEKTNLSVLSTASEINQIFNEIGLQKTKFGEFKLTVKIGISFGKVEWGIIQNKKQNVYYFKGDAIDNCSKCEKKCDKGDIVFDNNLKRKIQEINLKNKIEFTNKTDDYFLLKAIGSNPIIAITTNVTDSINYNNENKFIPKSVLHIKKQGEFRDIISCFISFKENKDWEYNISIIIDLTYQFGGYFNRISFGDKGGFLLIFFGAPTAHEKMFVRASDFVLEVQQLNLKGFKTRIGLTFGTAFAGFVGSKKRLEYTCLGNQVNLAARFMTKAMFGEIYVNKSIQNKTAEEYEYEFLNEINFKGFTFKIPVYELKRKTIISEQSQEFQKIKLVGREQELKKLKEFIKPVFENRFGGIVYVDGIAGIGKSRLVNELREKEKGRNGINWFYMPCDEILGKSYNPIIYFLRKYFNQSEENQNEKNKYNFENKLENLIEKTINDEIKKELVRTKSILGAMLDIHWENSLYNQLDAKGRYENTLYSLKNFIKAESLQKPVIIELEDGHWIDPDTRKFLEVLTRNVIDFPFIIVSPCRSNDDGSEYTFGLKEVPENRIKLEHFSKEGSKALIFETLRMIMTKDISSQKAIKIPSKTANLIHKKSEGNPFFIEQMILYFKENQLFDVKYNIKSDKFEIPANINEIIITRIDRLKTELKEVIKTASVLGRIFIVKILSGMLLGRSIDKQLLEGKKELIWEALTELKYIFKHTLIREAVYEMQLKKELRKLHKLAAETMEDFFRDDIKSYYPDLANHYEKAEIFEKNIEYLKKAGDFAKENYENEKAIKFYDKLLKNFKRVANPSERLRIDVFLKKAEIFELIGKWKEAETIYRKALKLSEEIDDTIRIAKSIGSVGVQYYLKGNYEKAMECYEKQLDISKKLNDKKIISIAIGNMGVIYSNKGNYEKAMECYEKKLKICQEIGDNRGISLTVGKMGMVHYVQGKYEEAMICYKDKLNISKKLGDKAGISKAIGNMGIIYKNQSNYKEAMLCYEEQFRICEEIGDKRGISIVVGNMGNIFQRQANFEKALECYEQKLLICEEIGDERGIAVSVGNMGVIHSNQGNLAKAMEYYKQLLNISTKLGDTRKISWVSGNMGLIYLVQGYYEKARQSFEKQIYICEKIGDKRGISIATVSIGDIYKNQTNYQKALNSYNKAISIGRELKLNYFLCIYLQKKADLLFEMDNPEANSINREALEIATKVDSKDIIFSAKILDEKINFQINNLNKSNRMLAIENLKKMLTNETKEENIATLNYEIWKMKVNIRNEKLVPKVFEINEEKYREIALLLYRKLYKKTPKIDYKNKIEELIKFNIE